MSPQIWSKAFVAALVLSACGSTNEVTPVGTVALDWDQSKATRAPYVTAKSSEPKTVDYTATFIAGQAPLVVTVHLTTAKVEYQEGSGWIRDRGPIAVKMTVAQNSDWTISNGKCGDGPNYASMDMKPTETPGLVLDCSFSYKRSTRFKGTWEMLGHVIIKGDQPGLFPPTDGTIK